MSWSAAEKTIYELLKVYYGSGSPLVQCKRLPQSVLQNGSGTLAEATVTHGVAAFFYEALSAGKMGVKLPGEAMQELKKAAGQTLQPKSG